jgi:hypothetical protein
MGRLGRGVLRWALAAGCLFTLIVVVAGLADNPDLESVNVTDVAWVTTMDADELAQLEEKATLAEQAEAGEEFSSMESILHWAIGNAAKPSLPMLPPWTILSST